MKISKALVQALGPLALAGILLGIVLLSPFSLPSKPSTAEMQNAATAMSFSVIRGNELKNNAIATGNYLPFFGSSELSRVNAFHPSVLARQYNRDYQPFLLGAPGTQSLSHFFLLNSLDTALKDKPIVFIISPQWFVQAGISDQMYSLYYSPLQTYQWLANVDKITVEESYLVERLLTFSSIKTDTYLSTMLHKIKDGAELSSGDKSYASRQYRLLSREDELFYRITTGNKEKRIEKSQKKLPTTYNLNQLEALATKLGEESTTNNEFEVSNKFYTSRIAPLKGKLKESQTKYNYLKSPEFSDFQLVLNQLAKENTKVLFVIPPVNERWSDYTGLSQEMLDTFSQKITEQLQSQGFDQIADYTQKRGESYFMEDTIHLGWRGWLTLDQDLQQFLNEDKKTNYHLDNQKYLSPEWQQRDEF